MPTVLSEPIFMGKNDPTEEVLRSWTIRGGSEQVEQVLKDKGWNGKDVVASVGLHMDSAGKITDSQLFLSGFMSVGRLSASMLWSGAFGDKDYIKVEAVNLAIFNIWSRMSSDWICGAKLDWIFKIYNPERKTYTVIDKLDEDNLRKVGASLLSFRLHLGLTKGPAIDIMLGMAPEAKIETRIGHNAQNFPMIQIGKVGKVSLLPAEPEGDYGLGLSPFLIYNGDGETPIPDIKDIREAIHGYFNNGTKPKLPTKNKNWQDAVALGRWEDVEPTYRWPEFVSNTTRDDEQGWSSKMLYKY